jgi:Bacterial toxin 46
MTTPDTLTLSRGGKDKSIAELQNILDTREAADKAKLLHSKQAELDDFKKRADKLSEKPKPTAAKAQPSPPPAGKTRHVAHAEGWKAVTTQPDLCKVGKDIVAFDSCAKLDKKHKASPNVIARSTPVYRKDDMFKEVQGDAGKHIVAGTSQGGGHVKILDGHDSVKVNNIPVARHDSKCMVNCDASGAGGALGKLVTEQKSTSASPASGAKNPNAPPGERTSDKLERLKEAKAKLESGQLDFNALDEYINFKEGNKGLDGLIGQIQGTPGTVGDYAAQATRGLLGFGKDIVMGVGELAYEGIKAVPKLGRMAYTSNGQAISQLNGAILAENISLGNITAGTVGQGALDIGSAIIKPVTDPWGKGQYVEAVTRGAAEIVTLPIAWTKAGKAADLAKAKIALEAADAAKAKAALEAEEAVKAKAALDAEEAAKAGDGVHVKKSAPIDPAVIAGRRKLAEDFYREKGFSDDSIKEHLKGIDFEKPVDVVTLKSGTEVIQYQVPGSKQGNYYTLPGTEPDAVGIAGQAKDRATGAIVDKVGTPHVVTGDVEVLRSTSAPIKDTWSIPGKDIQTNGGGMQYFTPDKGAITPTPKGKL